MIPCSGWGHSAASSKRSPPGGVWISARRRPALSASRLLQIGCPLPRHSQSHVQTSIHIAVCHAESADTKSPGSHVVLVSAGAAPWVRRIRVRARGEARSLTPAAAYYIPASSVLRTFVSSFFTTPLIGYTDLACGLSLVKTIRCCKPQVPFHSGLRTCIVSPATPAVSELHTTSTPRLSRAQLERLEREGTTVSRRYIDRGKKARVYSASLKDTERGA